MPANVIPMSDALAQHDAASSVAALSNAVREELRDDLDALRAAIQERLQAATYEADTLVERFVQDVSEIAQASSERAATEARREAEHSAQRELAAAREQANALIAELQRELAAAREACDEYAAKLKETGNHLGRLEAEREHLLLTGELAAACVEEERQRRRTVALQLETAREELRLAQAEAKTCRLEAQRAAAVAQQPGSSHPPGEPRHRAAEGAILDQIKKQLGMISAAQTADQLLASLLEALREHFVAAAVFAVGAHAFNIWRSNPAPDHDVPSTLLPLASESILARALQTRMTVAGAEVLTDQVFMQRDRTVGQAAALPIIVRDRVLAIVYVENPRDRTASDVAIFTKAAEILVGWVSGRLRIPNGPSASGAPQQAVADAPDGPRPAESPDYAIARQAGRVRMRDRVKAVVDGGLSTLIDLSTQGAQVLSSQTMARDRTVELALPRPSGHVTAKARVVWTKEERAANDAVLSRVGLQFIEVDPTAIQAFMSEHGVPRPPESGHPS